MNTTIILEYLVGIITVIFIIYSIKIIIFGLKTGKMKDIVGYGVIKEYKKNHFTYYMTLVANILIIIATIIICLSLYSLIKKYSLYYGLN